MSIDIGIDESMRPMSSVLVVSSIVGQTSLMRKFSSQMFNELELLGIDYFHSKEHSSESSKPYRGASASKRKRLLSSLIASIYKFSSFGISVSINQDEYKSLTSPRFRSQFGSPYAFAIQAMLEVLYGMMDVTNDTHETVNILMEEGHKNSNDVMQKLEAIKGHSNPLLRIGTYGLGSKKENPILQAADLLAYGSLQFVLKKESKMLKKLVSADPQRFPHLPCDGELISWQRDTIKNWFAKKKELAYAQYLESINMK